MHACCCMKLMCGTKKGGGLAPMSNVRVKFLSPLLLREGRWEEGEAAEGWCTLCSLRTRENWSLPRRYADNCHHNRSRSESCRASQGLWQPLQQKLLRLLQRCTGREKKSKLHFLKINLPNCLHSTTHLGRGEREKKKSKNNAEEIAQWRPYQDGSGRELVP